MTRDRYRPLTTAAVLLLTSGQSFWLHPFDCGSARKPPAPGPAAAVEEIQALLRAGTDDISPPEPLVEDQPRQELGHDISADPGS